MFKENEFKNKTFILTGASGYLGREITAQLNQSGGNVLLIDRDRDILKSVFSEFHSRYPNVENQIYDCDLENENSRNHLVDYVQKKLENIYCLINNAAFVGTSNLPGWAVEPRKQNISIWRRAMEVNLTSVFHLCQKLAPIMEKSGSGKIINISSIYGFLGPDWDLYSGTEMSNPAAYGVSKGGLIQLTKWLATVYAPKVCVNCVSPGGILRDQPEQFLEKYCKKTPLRRMATEGEIANAVLFLASNYSSYVTGHNLVVDGGWSLI